MSAAAELGCSVRGTRALSAATAAAAACLWEWRISAARCGCITAPRCIVYAAVAIIDALFQLVG